MKLSGLHILITYQYTYECELCFVWGSRKQSGALTLEQVEDILKQARDAVGKALVKILTAGCCERTLP